MNYLIRVPAYPIGNQLLEDEINRLMVKLNASHYIVGYFSQFSYYIEYKVIFLINNNEKTMRKKKKDRSKKYEPVNSCLCGEWRSYKNIKNDLRLTCWSCHKEIDEEWIKVPIKKSKIEKQ